MPPAADVVVLSSTPDHNPLRTPQQIPYNAGKLFGLSPRDSSPPPLVSPSELFRNVHTPADEPPQDTEKKVQKKTTKRTTNKPRESADTTEDKPKRSKKKTADERQALLGDLEPTALESKDNAAKNAPKPRAKRSDAGKKRGESKNKALTGKVSKSSSAETQQVGTKPPSQKDATKELDNREADGLQLEEATKRRLDWTPTKDTAQQIFELESDVDGEGSQKSAPARNFTGLLSGYGFTGTASYQTNTKTTEDGGPTKRRRIELMDSSTLPGPRLNASNAKDKTPIGEESQQATAGKKTKKQNKKPTTLTARVTARYASDYTEDADTQSMHFANARGGSKAKKSKEPVSIVLSPEAAVKSLEDQDLMFGTCSQLEREDSPVTLRDMQTAIHASENYMEPKPRSHTNPTTSSGSMISRFTAPRNLWCEASRDLDGAVAQAEVLDLVDGCDISQVSPRRDVRQHQSGVEKQREVQPVVDQPSGSTSKKEDSKRKGTSAAVEKLPGKSSRLTDDASRHKETVSTTVESRPKMPQYNGFTDAELSKQVASYGFKAVKGRQKMIDLLRKCWESKHGTNTTSNGELDGSTSKSASTKPPSEEESNNSIPPNKTSSTKPKQIKSTAKSAAKNEPAGKKRQGSSRPTSSSSQGATQPKPLSQKSFADVEEIEDSEDEAIPSPSRLQSRYETHNEQPSSQPLPISMAPSSPSRAASKHQAKQTTILYGFPEEEEDSLPDLATQITKAVRAQPRMSSAGGPKRPSWHEKILMYDPIVLENFATWLNTEGLGLVAEDREVGPGFLRRWCESKGICCCYGER